MLTACLTGCGTLKGDQPGYDRFVETSETVKQAKRTYQLGHSKDHGSAVTWEDLATCLPANWKPICKQGGVLTPGPIGEPMTCTVHGQLKPLN